jgi:hypothetical protein
MIRLLGVAAKKAKKPAKKAPVKKAALKPKPKPKPTVAGARPYTGYNGDATGITPGLQMFIREAEKRTGGALWNNGAFGIRDMRSKKTPSVHSTGRAVDLSYRKMPNKGISRGREISEHFFNTCLTNANEIGLELVIDYWPDKTAGIFGRAWRCDRQAWKNYDKPTVAGAPGGDWWHAELSPAAAKDPQRVKTAIAKAFGDNPPTS